MITWFRYVARGNVDEMQAKGWKVVHDLNDCHHGAHAVLMTWEGVGEPQD